jgi:nitrate/nitrite-specific signal transduction histidine kinase
MPPWQLNFGIFSLVAVIMLVMAGVSFGYLLRIKNRSRASQLLLWFFLCVILSAIATLLTNLGLAWSWAFAPSQDAFLILGGVFLARFAYVFPTQDDSIEARWIFRIFDGIAALALGYSLYFAYTYLSSLPVEIEEIRAYYLLTPIAIFGIVLVFFRRTIAVSMQGTGSEDAGQGRWFGFLSALSTPRNQSGTGIRNFGLALSIALIPVIVFLIKPALPALLASFFFNFGIVLSISATMLVYLNYAPEPTTITAKLVGISLVTILLLLGFTCILLLHLYPDLGIHRIVAIFIPLVLGSTAFVLIVFPIFFRATIFEPLARLLEGVRAANEGKLDVVVKPSFNDEIGFLSQSFNRTVRSLKEKTSTLENWGLDLEREVSQRTIDLVNINVRLEKEIKDRETAENKLNRQLIYQKSLAGCSQSLLVAAESDSQQQKVLDQALEHLREGAQASRAYIINKFEEPELGSLVRIFAEVCAPGIHAQIDNPANQTFPLSRFPVELVNELADGKPRGGPVREVFASTPEFIEILLSQKSPLLSVIFFPLFHQNWWWGFIGFDDCITEREWDAQEVSMLRTASEMIGSTLQRWKLEAQLRSTLEELEVRVRERTAELSQANINLTEEIGQRQLAQNDLEARLHIEEALANISTRLLEPTGVRENIAASLEELAGFMGAGRIFLVEFDPGATNQLIDYVDWHRSDLPPISEEVVQSFMDSMIGLRDQLRAGETIYIQDTSQTSNQDEFDMRALKERNVQSLVLSPITIDKRVRGILGCSDLQASSDAVQKNFSALELVASMLKSLLQREQLIQTLEEQVAERTHQLTTFLDMAILSDQAQDLSDILQPTLLSIIQIAACDAAAIHVINEERSALELIAQRGISLEFLQPLRVIEFEVELSNWLMESSKTTRVSDDSESNPGLPGSFHFPEYHTIFSSRLKTGGKSLGLLSCYRIADQPFSPFQSTLLTALGELLGIVVENHRLRSEAERLAAVEERQRLAREIHDAISQSVYSLSLFARSARDASDVRDEDKLLSNLQDIEMTALQAMREMRLLLYELREVVQDVDIAEALDTRFKQVENRLGIQATVEIGEDIIIKNHIRQEIWRIIIEALNNAVKHASASQVRVQIICPDDYLIVLVQDDGVGFDVKKHSAGMGLKNIQARTDILGGHLDIISESGQGTLIRLKAPKACVYPDERE